MSVVDPILNKAIRKLESVEKKTNDYLDKKMNYLFKTYVIPEMQSVAMAMNLPREFADGIKFRKTGYCTGQVINTWGGVYSSSGQFAKPLALWFNYGTPRHWIAPKDPDGVLAWKSTGPGRNANAIFYQGSAKKGDWLFSKGHFVSGLPRTEAMEIGLARGMKRLKEALPMESERDLKDE